MYLTKVLGGGVSAKSSTPLGLALGPQVWGPSFGTSPQNTCRGPGSRDRNTYMHVAVDYPGTRRYECTH